MERTIREIVASRKAALIDMDGVLYDSMPLHAVAWHETMLRLGLDIPAEEFFLYEGMTGPATINLILERERGEWLPLDRCLEIYEGKARLFREMARVEPMPGARAMIDSLLAAGLKLVLVTGSAQSSLLTRLDTDYPGAFPPDMRVTALDVKNGKPHPEPYLKGLEKAGVLPSEAMVIENAPLGVRAGKAAGIFTVAVTTGPVPASEFEKEKADVIVGSMPELARLLSAPSLRNPTV